MVRGLALAQAWGPQASGLELGPGQGWEAVRGLALARAWGERALGLELCRGAADLGQGAWVAQVLVAAASCAEGL